MRSGGFSLADRREKFYWCDAFNCFREALGYRLTIPELPNVTFYLAKTGKTTWDMTEARSGYRVGPVGATSKQDCLLRFLDWLDTHKHEWPEMVVKVAQVIDAQIARTGLSPLYKESEVTP